MASIQTYPCGLQTAHVQYHTALLTSSSGWTSSAFTDHTAAMGYKQHMYSTILPCLPAAQDGYRPPSQTTPLLCSGASFPSAARREEANVHIVGKWCIGCHEPQCGYTHTQAHRANIVSTSSLPSPLPPFPPLPHTSTLFLFPSLSIYLARCHSTQFLEGITQLPCLLDHLVARLCPLLSILQFHASNAGPGVSGMSGVNGVRGVE